jgi:hypothetical protein
VNERAGVPVDDDSVTALRDGREERRPQLTRIQKQERAASSIAVRDLDADHVDVHAVGASV